MASDVVTRLREDISRYEVLYRSNTDDKLRKTLTELIAEARKRLNALEGKPPDE
jgi:predicted aminopeptidase